MTEDVTINQPPSPAERDDLWTPAGRLVDRRVRKWQRDLLHGGPSQQAASMAALARLRRGVGKPAGSVPDILALTLAPELVGQNPSDDATEQETAAHHALTMYALHQQSRTQAMHRRGGDNLGGALRRLLGAAEPGYPPDPITRRFQVVITADSLHELIYHARGAVQLLRGAQVPLDYGLLADELVWWQHHDRIAGVRRTWARAFYRPRRQPSAASASPSESTDGNEPEGN